VSPTNDKKTIKTLTLLGGVALGGYLVYRYLKPLGQQEVSPGAVEEAPPIEEAPPTTPPPTTPPPTTPNVVVNRTGTETAVVIHVSLVPDIIADKIEVKLYDSTGRLVDTKEGQKIKGLNLYYTYPLPFAPGTYRYEVLVTIGTQVYGPYVGSIEIPPQPTPTPTPPSTPTTPPTTTPNVAAVNIASTTYPTSTTAKISFVFQTAPANITIDEVQLRIYDQNNSLCLSKTYRNVSSATPLVVELSSADVPSGQYSYLVLAKIGTRAWEGRGELVLQYPSPAPTPPTTPTPAPSIITEITTVRPNTMINVATITFKIKTIQPVTFDRVDLTIYDKNWIPIRSYTWYNVKDAVTIKEDRTKLPDGEYYYKLWAKLGQDTYGPYQGSLRISRSSPTGVTAEVVDADSENVRVKFTITPSYAADKLTVTFYNQSGSAVLTDTLPGVAVRFENIYAKNKLPDGTYTYKAFATIEGYTFGPFTGTLVVKRPETAPPMPQYEIVDAWLGLAGTKDRPDRPYIVIKAVAYDTATGKRILGDITVDAIWIYFYDQNTDKKVFEKNLTGPRLAEAWIQFPPEFPYGPYLAVIWFDYQGKRYGPYYKPFDYVPTSTLPPEVMPPGPPG